MHIISSSKYGSLHLTDSEFKEYEKDELALFLKWQRIEVEARGIFAGNQGKYVNSLSELTPWDGVPLIYK